MQFLYKPYLIVKNNVFKFQPIVMNPKYYKDNINEDKNGNKQNEMGILHHLRNRNFLNNFE